MLSQRSTPQPWQGEFHILSNIKIAEDLLGLTTVIYGYEKEDAHETVLQSQNRSDAWWGGLNDPPGFLVMLTL